MSTVPDATNAAVDRVRHRGRLGLAGTAVLAMAVLAACSSSHKPAANVGVTTTTSASSASTTTASSASTAASSPTSVNAASALSALTSKLQSGDTTSYEATYTTSGGSSGPQTVEFAAKPPNSYSFTATSASGSKSALISNSTTAYACQASSGSSSWTCTQLPAADLGAYAEVTQIFKGSYWATDLGAVEAAAAANGITVTPSSMTVAGASLQCVTYSGSSTNKGGEVCVTSQGVLGYVHDTSSGETFQLTSYSTSPAASLFQLPSGATVTTIP